MRIYTIEISKRKKFSVKTDIPEYMIEAALDNWIARTNKKDAQSFCDYVNNKGVHTATPHIITTKNKTK